MYMKYTKIYDIWNFCPHILNFRDIPTAFYRLHHAVSCCPVSYSSSVNCMKCQMTYVCLGWGKCVKCVNSFKTFIFNCNNFSQYYHFYRYFLLNTYSLGEHTSFKNKSNVHVCVVYFYYTCICIFIYLFNWLGIAQYTFFCLIRLFSLLISCCSSSDHCAFLFSSYFRKADSPFH